MIVNFATGVLFKHSLLLYAVTLEVVVVEQSSGAITTTCCQAFWFVEE